MKVLYHLPILRPHIPQAEALSQEIAFLCQHFDGEVVYLNPNQHLPVRLPRLLFGWHRLLELRQREDAYDLHHFFNPDPFPFPVLRWLRKPVIYSITGGVEQQPNVTYLNQMAGVAVSSEAGEQRLRQWGVRNVFLVRPGIDVSRFTHTAVPLTRPFHLLMASAPWTNEQFGSKGVDALIEVCLRRPQLHLTFLWRGVLVDKMMARVERAGLGERLQVIDQLVDVNRMLARHHAAIVLAETSAIVKAYPHSLLDALAAGKPVLISQAIPMAEYVARSGCGVVVPAVTAEAIGAALDKLIANYDEMQQSAQVVGQRDFGVETMLASYRKVYQVVVGSDNGTKRVKSLNN